MMTETFLGTGSDESELYLRGFSESWIQQRQIF